MFLLRKRAQLGLVKSQYNLAICYLYGYSGFSKNEEKYFHWLKLAAQAGYGPAQLRDNRYSLYDAITWLTLARDNGVADAPWFIEQLVEMDRVKKGAIQTASK